MIVLIKAMNDRDKPGATGDNIIRAVRSRRIPENVINCVQDQPGTSRDATNTVIRAVRSVQVASVTAITDNQNNNLKTRSPHRLSELDDGDSRRMENKFNNLGLSVNVDIPDDEDGHDNSQVPSLPSSSTRSQDISAPPVSTPSSPSSETPAELSSELQRRVTLPSISDNTRTRQNLTYVTAGASDKLEIFYSDTRHQLG